MPSLFLGFLGFVNVYAMRVNLSVAIVYMAEPGVFNWNEKEKVIMIMMMMLVMIVMVMMTRE